MYGEGWSRAFGWSESELCKQNAAQLFLNPNDPELLAKLKNEIIQNYEKVDWSEKYKYIQIQPQTVHVVIFIIVLFMTQIGLYVFFHINNLTFPLDFH
jgi:ABC-type lipoprotein release transport system permease subunit